MPSTSPEMIDAARTELQALGLRIRSRRKGLGISAVRTAQTAKMSRVTLHRIERGGPSVTIGAYFNVLCALGLDLGVHVGEVCGPASSPGQHHAPAL